MKKFSTVLLIVISLCLLSSCGGDEPKDPGMDAVAEAVFTSIDTENMAQIPDAYVENMMLIAPDGYVSRNTIISSVGTNINEYGIFQGKDEEQTAALKTALEDYLAYRQELWMDEYLPQEKPKLDNAKVWVEGNYVMYAILGDEELEAAHNAFSGCFEG